ncbi:MAG: kinase [Caulobacteraceae bacterium]
MSFAERLKAFLAAEDLPPSFAEAVGAVYAPLAMRVAEAARRHGPGFVVGLCGAQGSGKSTLVAVLEMLLDDAGLRTATLSLDDFYLPRADRAALADAVHPLLATRGVPGTHDVALAVDVVDRLRAGEGALAPRFDKAADTRMADWDRLDGPTDVILFEGWCVGATPEPASALSTPLNALERERDAAGVWRTYVNEQLAGPYRALFGRVDMLILLQAPSFEVVLGWRTEQEHKLKARRAREGRGLARAMSDAEVAAFIAHYERITRRIQAEMPARVDVVVRLGGDRRPVA